MEAPTPLSLAQDRMVHAECLAAAMLESGDSYYVQEVARNAHAEARAHARVQREQAVRMRRQAVSLRRRLARAHSA